MTHPTVLYMDFFLLLLVLWSHTEPMYIVHCTVLSIVLITSAVNFDLFEDPNEMDTTGSHTFVTGLKFQHFSQRTNP